MYSREVLLSVFSVYYESGEVKEFACVGKITPSAFRKKIANSADVLVRSSQVCGVVGDDRYLVTKAPKDDILFIRYLGYDRIKCSMEKEFFVHMSNQQILH